MSKSDSESDNNDGAAANGASKKQKDGAKNNGAP
jgi:hypothetical protein